MQHTHKAHGHPADVEAQTYMSLKQESQSILFFWLIKILCTHRGEDALIKTLTAQTKTFLKPNDLRDLHQQKETYSFLFEIRDFFLGLCARHRAERRHLSVTLSDQKCLVFKPHCVCLCGAVHSTSQQTMLQKRPPLHTTDIALCNTVCGIYQMRNQSLEDDGSKTWFTY